MILYHGSFGKDTTDYDLVVGGVANDKVFNTVELFFDGLIDKAEAINVCVMKNRMCKFVSAEREHCLSCILKGVKLYDSKSDFTSKKNIAVSLRVLQNGREFHWMRH